MLKAILSKFTFFKEESTSQLKLLAVSSKKLYNRALTHKSFDQIKNNEQLEFLGDAILSSIVSELLFLDNPQKEEGFLSQKRAIIVSRRHLNLIGRKKIPKHYIKNKIKDTPLNIFGNTLEAIIGAIYLEKGLGATKKFIKKHIYNSEFLPLLLDADYKSQLLKYSQKKRLKVEYKLEGRHGRDHEKEFCVSIFIDGKRIAEAIERSKKEAEQKAAEKVITKILKKQ